MPYFGSSGIRGVFGDKITPELALSLGRAIGTTGKKDVAISRDTRVSGKLLKMALTSGLLSSGCSVTSFGITPTPVLCFGTRHLKRDTGVMITASHNPAEYNGFKLWNGHGRAYSREQEEEIEALLDSRQFIQKELSRIPQEIQDYDASVEYIEAIEKAVSLGGGKKVLLDTANGAAFGISPLLLKKFGYNLISINDEPNGLFPSRMPEPIEKNLQEACNAARKENCDIGFCHDGDADRVIPIDDKARVVNFDKFLAFLCEKSIEETGNNKVVTTVDASSLIEDYLPDAKVFRTKVGDVHVANKCDEVNACFGGEPSGSFIFPEFGLWPDGIYAIAKTLKFLDGRLSEILARMPDYHFERAKLQCTEEMKKRVMETLKSDIPEKAEVLTIDGLRIKDEDHTVLIRPSGTEALIRINVEARSSKVLKEKMDHWKNTVRRVT